MSIASTANGTLTSVGPVSGADHLAMSYLSWQEQTFAQGGPGGALEWLVQRTRSEGGEQMLLSPERLPLACGCPLTYSIDASTGKIPEYSA